MGRQPTFGLLFVFSCFVPGCSVPNPTYCDETDPECREGFVCNVAILTCLPKDYAGRRGARSNVVAQDSAVGAADAAGGAGDRGVTDAAGGSGSDAVEKRDAGLDDGPGFVPADVGVAWPDVELPDLGVSRKGLGQSCGNADECSSGICVHGVCCDGACGGTCQSCAVAGKEGRCNPVPVGKDPHTDCAGQTGACKGSCDGKGGCGFPGAETSCGATGCTAGELTLRGCDGRGVCTSRKQGCGGFTCADASRCRTSCSTPDQCVAGLVCNGTCIGALKNGEACGTNSAICQSGYCIDGVCCEGSCGECQACNLGGSQGRCAPITGPAPTGQCAGDAQCGPGQCKAGKCDYKTGTLCSETCASDTHVVEGCNSAGRCEVAQSDACAPYRCDTGNKCRTNCVDHAHCIAASVCDRIEAHMTGAGKCIDPAKVMEFNGTDAEAETARLNKAVNAASVLDKTHMKLTGKRYGQIILDSDETVTIIGVDQPKIEPFGSQTGGVVSVKKGSLSVQGLRITSGGSDGVRCAHRQLRLVESSIEFNEGHGIGDCEGEVRRSIIRGNGQGGITHLAGAGGAVTIANNLITGNGRCVKRAAGACSVADGTGGIHLEFGGCQASRIHFFPSVTTCATPGFLPSRVLN